MNILTRDFTKSEKILLVVLGVVIVAALYYLLVFNQVETQIASSKDNALSLESELQVTQAQINRINTMSKEMEQLSENDVLKSYMPSYNAKKSEIEFLHLILEDTEDYFISFTNLVREKEQIRRDFSLQFTAKDYSQAQNIIEQLEESEIRCLVGDVYITPKEKEESLLEGMVIVNLTGTFYETLMDGTPDKELPEDTSGED